MGWNDCGMNPIRTMAILGFCVGQRERWRWSPEGWKLAMVDGVRDQKRLVDGKPE